MLMLICYVMYICCVVLLCVCVCMLLCVYVCVCICYVVLMFQSNLEVLCGLKVFVEDRDENFYEST